MNTILQKLKDWGFDVEGAMERVLDDEEFYLSCAQLMSEDPGFEELGEALAKGDVPKAFDAAHSLKGVIANMGATPLYETIVEIVEPLRAGKTDGTEQAYQELLKRRDHLKALLNA